MKHINMYQDIYYYILNIKYYIIMDTDKSKDTPKTPIYKTPDGEIITSFLCRRCPGGSTPIAYNNGSLIKCDECNHIIAQLCVDIKPGLP
jgi:hypothetical protein